MVTRLIATSLEFGIKVAKWRKKWLTLKGLNHMGVSENRVPLFTQWLMIIVPIKWL